MRIAYIAAGAGAMYCGACARDALLARGLIAASHEVQFIPLYTPLKLELDDLPLTPIFFGGITVFLEQAAAIFRHMPRPLEWLLERPALLRLLSRFAIDIEPRNLGPMTVSVLAGTHGKQKSELQRLLHYLTTTFHPEIVNLTNSLLSGLVPELRKRLNIPIVCTYQGEAQFVADFPEPHRSQALALIRENARAIDLVISPSQALVPAIADFLALPPERITVIRTAAAPAPIPAIPPDHGVSTPFTIGYLSVIRPPKGLDLLLEALRILVRDQQRNTRLLIAGRILHRPFWKSLQQKIRREALADHVEFLGEVDAPGKAAFFSRIHAFCLPSRYPEPRGVAVLEALAHGIPCVVPNAGVYPEFFALVGSPSSGLLVSPDAPPALAQALAHLMDHPAETAARAAQGRTLIADHCSPAQMVQQTIAAYQRLRQSPPIQ